MNEYFNSVAAVTLKSQNNISRIHGHGHTFSIFKKNSLIAYVEEFDIVDKLFLAFHKNALIHG